MDIHSWLVLSQTDGRPMYQQIMQQIKQKIALGDWPTGTEIPSIRQLAVQLQISVITVKRAYQELEHEGVIVTRHGKGSFVAEHRGLQPQLVTEDLHAHLTEAARLAHLLGLTQEETLRKLRKAMSDLTPELDREPHG